MYPLFDDMVLHLLFDWITHRQKGGPMPQSEVLNPSLVGTSTVDFEQKLHEGKLSARERIALLQTQIEATAFPSPPPYHPGMTTLLQKLTNVTSIQFLRGAFAGPGETWDDILPQGRRKQLHSTGVTALFEMRPRPNTKSSTNPFTGILGPVASRGILRVSNAKGPLSDKQPHVQPGMGIKWAIDGAQSLNVLAMPSLIPQQRKEGLDQEGKMDFFRFPFTTHPSIPGADEFPFISDPFEETQKSFESDLFERPNRLPLEHLGGIEPDGTKIPLDRVCAPYELFFKPTQELTGAIEDLKKKADPGLRNAYLLDIRQLLVAFGTKLKGKALFDVFARHKWNDRKAVYTHQIFLTGEFVSSRFGDARLWFPHHVPESSQQKTCPFHPKPLQNTRTRTRWLASTLGLKSRAIAPEKRGPEVEFERST